VSWWMRFLQWAWGLLPDKCQLCRVSFWKRLRGYGGARGNENIVNDVVMCDYCHARYMSAKRKRNEDSRLR